MRCRKCARLEARIIELRQLRSLARGEHLKSLQLNNPEAIAHLEEAMFSYSEAIKSALGRLIEHRLECESATCTMRIPRNIWLWIPRAPGEAISQAKTEYESAQQLKGTNIFKFRNALADARAAARTADARLRRHIEGHEARDFP